MASNGPLWCWPCWWPDWILLVRWSCCWCCQWWFRPEQLSLIYHLHTNARENSPNVAKIMEAVDKRKVWILLPKEIPPEIPLTLYVGVCGTSVGTRLGPSRPVICID